MSCRSYMFWIVVLLATAVLAAETLQPWLPGSHTVAQSGLSPSTGLCGLYAASASSIKAEVTPSTAPLAGDRVDAILKLSQLDGTPVTFGDLEVAHTKRIHLLIIDEALNDYTHEHPVETSIPGSFSFNFHPRYGGHYVLWADLLPAATGRQEYVRTDLWVAGPPGVPSQRLNRSAAVDRCWFDLSTAENMPFIAGQVASVQVVVSDPQGRPVSRLEPLMGAFAHGVGFTSDLSSVLHVHPLGSAATDENDRGGPILNFMIVPRQPGYMKFYVQVQLNGKNVFAGFGLHVLSVAEAKDFSQPTKGPAMPNCD